MGWDRSKSGYFSVGLIINILHRPLAMFRTNYKVQRPFLYVHVVVCFRATHTHRREFVESCLIVSLNIASHLSFVCKIVNVLLLSVQKWNKSVGYFMPLLSHGNQQFACQSCKGREGCPILFKSYKKPFSQVSCIFCL